MILGIGIDVVHPQRLRRWQQIPGLLERFYHPEELAQCRRRSGEDAVLSLAARFAAKEAFGKALGSGLAGLALRDMVVMNNPARQAGDATHRIGQGGAAAHRRHARVHFSVARETGGAGDVRDRERPGRPRGSRRVTRSAAERSAERSAEREADHGTAASGAANVMLTLAYDGTDFAGWQVQNRQRTVQGVLEAALARMLDRPVRVRAAGRTDSGVHAIGQVANFTAPMTFAAERWAVAINSYLPPDVRVLAARPVAAGFDARRSALARGYRYQLLSGAVGLPHPAPLLLPRPASARPPPNEPGGRISGWRT